MNNSFDVGEKITIEGTVETIKVASNGDIKYRISVTLPVNYTRSFTAVLKERRNDEAGDSEDN